MVIPVAVRVCPGCQRAVFVDRVWLVSGRESYWCLFTCGKCGVREEVVIPRKNIIWLELVGRNPR